MKASCSFEVVRVNPVGQKMCRILIGFRKKALILQQRTKKIKLQAATG
jgi:hypothetical protein